MNRIDRAKVASFLAGLILSGCGIGGLGGPFPGVPSIALPGEFEVYRGPLAAPQIGYRIDQARYFEIVPRENHACRSAELFFTDTGEGIHTYISQWHSGFNLQDQFLIDAANTRYLVAPLDWHTNGCSSGGLGCTGAVVPYSTDGGRTWRTATPRLTHDDKLYLADRMLYYAGQRVDLERMREGPTAWEKYYVTIGNALPPLRKMPADNVFHCSEEDHG